MPVAGKLGFRLTMAAESAYEGTVTVVATPAGERAAC